MVLDSSALVAIFLGEPERSQFLDAIAQAATRHLAVANVLESAIVLEARRGEAAGRELDAFLALMGIEIVPMEANQLHFARMAWRKFGKGRHPAGLNFGDCIAYALARVLDEPLLAKGNEFRLAGLQVV